MASTWSWDPETVHTTMADHPKVKNRDIEAIMPTRTTIPPSTVKTVPPATVRAPLAETSANTSPKKPTAAKKPPASRKRKPDTQDAPAPDPATLPEISDDDPRLHFITDNCNQVRKKIRAFIESGGMKVGEFQNAIDVSPGAYNRFMGQNGPFKGEGCATFSNAFVFFKKRELQGLSLKGPKAKPAAKKVKMAESGGVLDVGGVTLEDEDTGEVAIYDTCDEVRKKLRAYLRKDDVTQAALLRALASGFHDGKKLTSAQLNNFLGKKGPLAGNTSGVFYAGYVFFEKRRIKEGKAKTQMRLEMEEEWEYDFHSGRSGVQTEFDMNKGYICPVNSHPVLDKYGKMSFIRG